MSSNRIIRAFLVSFVLAAALASGLGRGTVHAMEIKILGNQVVMSRGVKGNEHTRLRELLDRNSSIDTVILKDSPGGDSDAGYKVGELIRAYGLKTAVSGYCHSSCSRMFLGGKERYFTDDQPAHKTSVAFHGNYKSNGQLNWDKVGYLTGWIVKYSDGKADEALVARWARIEKERGFVYFFDPTRLMRADRVSVFFCHGDEPKENHFDYCEKLPDKNAYQLGVVTSETLIHVNQLQ